MHAVSFLGKTLATLKLALVGGVMLAGSAPRMVAAEVEERIAVRDGTWTWFNDERAIVLPGGAWLIGHVRSDGRIAITRFDPADGRASETVLNEECRVLKDDHDNPSLTRLADGRVLALYALHSVEARFYARTSLHADPRTAADWGPERPYATPIRTCYSNTYRLTAEQGAIFNFHRCINFNPTLSISRDEGATWEPAIHVIQTGTGRVRPYPRYCSDGVKRIDLIYTDGHPATTENSIYHLIYEAGAFRGSEGRAIAKLGELPMNHDAGVRGTPLYTYSNAPWQPGQGPDDYIPAGRGWTWDIHYAKDGKPRAVFQARRGDVMGTGFQGDRIYYYYARWDGARWQKRFIAQAGRPLYVTERDYGGGMALDPEDPNVVYISSNAREPFRLGDLDDVPLNAHDRYELYRGVTRDGGATFRWEPLTRASTQDNLRPIVPERHGRTEALLWFRGRYTKYQDFQTEIVARIGAKR